MQENAYRQLHSITTKMYRYGGETKGAAKLILPTFSKEGVVISEHKGFEGQVHVPPLHQTSGTLTRRTCREKRATND